MYKFSKNMFPELFDKKSDMLQLYMNILQDHTVLINIQSEGTISGQEAFSYSGAYIWNFILSHIEPNRAIGTFNKLCTALLLNLKEDPSNWISTNMDISIIVCLLV